MTDIATFSKADQQLETELTEKLRTAARGSVSWDVVHRPSTRSSFPARVFAAQKSLRRLERELARLKSKREGERSRDATLLELRSSLRLLRSAVRAFFAQAEELAHLPRVVLPAERDEPRAAAVAARYIRTVDWAFSESTFRIFIQALQVQEPLELGELWNSGAFLSFVLTETVLEKAFSLLRSPDESTDPAISTCLRSLVTVKNAAWTSLIEPLIVFDATLRQDPAGTYQEMDFESREQYRKRIAFIARHSDFTESHVAQCALNLAMAGSDELSPDSRVRRRRNHIGFYLVDKGFPLLASKVEFHPRPIDRARVFVREHADDFYITGTQLVTVFFLAALLFPIIARIGSFSSLVAVIVFMLLPVMQCAVDLVNTAVTTVFDPEPLPKLDFSKSVPREFATLVVVPTLLLKEDQVRDLATDLEVRFLANRDPNIHFALLTDLPDSIVKPHKNDTHPLVELAVKLIDELNTRYASSRNGSFLLLHRHRTFNVRQGVWMGWERKRGKLLDLNKLLAGEFDAFPIKAGSVEVLKDIRYVLTLDSDTQLPRKSAARLIGTIAHPLNQAVVDPEKRLVVDGYGILQPRIGVSVHSASRSRLAALYSGQSGFDIYTRAISDAYQDLYREGSFTGKGIYEASVFHSVLNGRFPRNSLLSHDLIEGAFLRAGLVTDTELIDDYPSHWSAYSRRKHRWVRGDWQIVQWLLRRVPDESGRWVPSPISTISRWKIFDNLRRSLVEPATMILFVAGWLGLPGGALYWTLASLGMLFFPAFVQLVLSMSRALFGEQKGKLGESFAGFRRALMISLITLALLPHQTLLAIDAIVRSLVRRLITGARLLEWETAAQAESKSARRAQVDRYLGFTPFLAFGIAALIFLVRPHGGAILVAAPILILWACANDISSWLNALPQGEGKRLGRSEVDYLRGHALRIWRYFHQFGRERHNYLIPDNVEEEGLREAARISPTNVGLLLNVRQAACIFGFLTVPEFATNTEKSLATIERLRKCHGHLYNWYDTVTLQPLGDNPFVSSVDSGNFLASLYTLRAGALDLLKRPLLAPEAFASIRAHWLLMQSQVKLPSVLARLGLPKLKAKVGTWIEWLETVQTAFAGSDAAPKLRNGHDGWWYEETRVRIDALLSLVTDYMPWLLPELSSVSAIAGQSGKKETASYSLEDAVLFSMTLQTSMSQAESAAVPSDGAAERLRAMLPAATQNLRILVARLQSIAETAERLANAMDFTFLTDPGRQILSIGYESGKGRLYDACYDLLASEARVATFLAVARDEIPQQSWIKLGRDHAYAYGRFVLLSWTGTMFEYLMPALWMRTYPETLIANTLRASVSVQRDFGRNHGLPWGISESGFAQKDEAGHYGYHAFGIPQVALSAEASSGPVVAPYATFLALSVDSPEALKNLRRMESSGWVGPFGFYEAADFKSSYRKPELVREWMAHHQGMSLLAVLNLLHDNAAQEWFHANPVVQSAELILHETPVSRGVLRAKMKEQ